MQDPNKTHLAEKSIKEQAQIVYMALEELMTENLVFDGANPTEEEINNMLMVLIMLPSHIFDTVLSETNGHLRETIATAWVKNIHAALMRGRAVDQTQRKNGTHGKETSQEKTD